MMPRRQRTGFTLIELLVVIAVIAILIALLVPAVQKVRAAAASTQCQNNIKQLVLAANNFESAYKRYNKVGDPVCGNGLQNANSSYLVSLLPYVEQGAIFENIANGDNKDVATPITVFMCPMDPRYGNTTYDKSQASTSYVGITGWDYASTTRTQLGIYNQADLAPLTGYTPASLTVTPVMVTDGTSNTIMIGERPISCDLFWGWWSFNVGYDAVSGSRNASELSAESIGGAGCTPQATPGHCSAAPYFFGGGPNNVSYLCSMNQLWSCHAGGAFFGFADGSVRFIDYTAANPLVVDLSTFAGAEVIDVEF